jgi:hypothetical protein
MTSRRPLALSPAPEPFWVGLATTQLGTRGAAMIQPSAFSPATAGEAKGLVCFLATGKEVDP